MLFSDDKNQPGDRELPATFQVRDKRRFLDATAADESAAAEGGEGGEKRFPSYVEELREKLRLSEARVEAVQEKFQEARAELRAEADEIRARLSREYNRRLEQVKVELLGSFLDVVDNLERTIEAAETGGDPAALLQGVHATYLIFQRRMAEAGLEPVESEGVKFQPEMHEAVETAEVDPRLDGMVLSTLQKGYRVGEKLVRPARVKVGRSLGSPAPAAPAQMSLSVGNEADDT